MIASAIFLLAAKLISELGVKVGQNTPPTRHKIPQSDSDYIRESIFNFTAHFGEINPDMPYLCSEGRRGPKGLFLPLFPLFGGNR